MRLRFLADADLHQAIVAAAVRPRLGIGFKAAAAAGLKGLDGLQMPRKLMNG